MEERSRSTTIKLEGRLAGLWVPELERVWRTALDSPRAQCILVDLRGVSSFDAAGKELLAQIQQAGAEFLADGLMTKYVVEQVTQTHTSDERKEG